MPHVTFSPNVTSLIALGCVSWAPKLGRIEIDEHQFLKTPTGFEIFLWGRNKSV
jgi:hypothetical protein